jgi:hypothetical protein
VVIPDPMLRMRTRCGCRALMRTDLVVPVKGRRVMATRVEVSPSANTFDSAAVVGARVAVMDPANAADRRGMEDL